jgi:hypothetical protein
MKFFIYSLVIALLGYLLHSFIPWWSIVIITGIIGALARLSSIQSFLMGFLGVALLWGLFAFVLNMKNDGILATRVGELFGGVNPLGLVLITTLIGGLIGGMGALTGQLGWSVFRPTSR